MWNWTQNDGQKHGYPGPKNKRVMVRMRFESHGKAVKRGYLPYDDLIDLYWDFRAASSTVDIVEYLPEKDDVELDSA